MSDVYGFGVVLLELITGKRSMDKTRPSQEQSLVEWARPLLKDPRKLDRIIDPRLEGQYSTKGAQKASALAYKCLSHNPMPRPTMSEVVKILESLQDFDNSLIEPFVYVVSDGNVSADFAGKEEEANASEEDNKSDEENGYFQYHKRRQRTGWRHQRRLPMSPISYSDSALHKNFRNGLSTPNLIGK